LAASTRALDLRGCEASPDHVGQQVERKSMSYRRILVTEGIRRQRFELAI
jgi:hypothetical protein